ncbi:4Fe-4S dicluster domain-containing protein [Gemmatimonadota bacterium]
MAESAGKKEKVVRVDFAFRRELAEKVEGNLASFCYQCGACVGDCPAMTYTDDFNPRQIMLKVLYGLGEELIGDESYLWECTNCYNCAERCPQEVKPAEVIISMKNMMADRGQYPPGVEKVIDAFLSEGRTVAMNPAIDKQRAKFGLAPLSAVPMDEIAVLIGLTDGEGEKE